MFGWRAVRGYGIFVGVALSAAAFWRPTPASACSPPPCWDSQFVPADSAVVPSNLAGLLWEPNPSSPPMEATAADFTLLRVEGASEIPVGVTVTELRPGLFFVAPDAPFEQGMGYRASAEHLCESEPTLPPVALEFSAVRAAAEPAVLGSLTATDPWQGPLRVAVWDGSCDREIDAVQVRVTVELSAGAAPWSDALLWSTWVDGQRYAPLSSLGSMHYDPPAPGASWQGRGEDLLFASCDAVPYTEQGLSEGSHTVQLRASLPAAVGAEPRFASNEIEIELDCLAGTPPDAGAGAAGPGGAAASPQGGMASGCGCRLAATAARAWRGWFILGLLGFVGRARRTRSQRPR